MPKLWWGSRAWTKKRIADLEEHLLVAECAVTTEREQREIAEKKAARLRSGLDTVTLTFIQGHIEVLCGTSWLCDAS